MAKKGMCCGKRTPLILILTFCIFVMYTNIKSINQVEKSTSQMKRQFDEYTYNATRIINLTKAYISSLADGLLQRSTEEHQSAKEHMVQRKSHLSKMCELFRRSTEYENPQLFYRYPQTYIRNITFPTYPFHLLWCPVFKAGYTNWNKTFLDLDAKLDPRSTDITNSSNIDTKHHHVRFLIVRNPWERLLSAFLDRLEYHPQMKSFQRDHFGRLIMAKYHNVNASALPYEKINVTFQEFLQFIVDEPRQTKHHLADHWVQYYEYCKPCDIDYNYIGKVETLSQDANYILYKLGFISARFKDQKAQTTAKMVKYYESIPCYLMDKLSLVFFWDFKLFDYDLKYPACSE
ncbi:unnamed protein product [Owenia fusiformis]|uniref:Carbohydrate sulfotransferase n=1 Tax=Owenia fusiformis TaxID=6347 RepID=A0A8S4MWV5_OWEFU|nr:unnamed protein product [Owenia fusiformis]